MLCPPGICPIIATTLIHLQRSSNAVRLSEKAQAGWIRSGVQRIRLLKRKNFSSGSLTSLHPCIWGPLCRSQSCPTEIVISLQIKDEEKRPGSYFCSSGRQKGGTIGLFGNLAPSTLKYQSLL